MQNDKLGLEHDLGTRHAYVPSVGVTITVEGFPQLSVMDDHDNVRHKRVGAVFAMSAHKECAVVDHVYVQLVGF